MELPSASHQLILENRQGMNRCEQERREFSHDQSTKGNLRLENSMYHLLPIRLALVVSMVLLALVLPKAFYGLLKQVMQGDKWLQTGLTHGQHDHDTVTYMIYTLQLMGFDGPGLSGDSMCSQIQQSMAKLLIFICQRDHKDTWDKHSQEALHNYNNIVLTRAFTVASSTLTLFGQAYLAY